MANVSKADMLNKVDNASDQFAGVITKTEKAIFDSAVALIKKLDIDSQGHIRTTTANLKLLSDIKSRLGKLTKSKEYLKGVKELVKAFDDIYHAQVSYYSTQFAKKTLSDNAKKKFAAMQRIAVTNTIEGLTGSGVNANVTEELSKILLRAVTTGAKYSDLVDEFRSKLISSGDNISTLAKYANTYATTALTQYAGQNNKLFTDDLGTEWFEYVGSQIETTRELCNTLLEHHPYIHKSEIKDILAGRITDQQTGEVIEIGMNPKTGLPKGMIEGTTPDNFQVNVGGWNCRHQLVPIAKEAVPENIRAKYDKATQQKIAQQKAEEEKQKKIAELKGELAKYANWKDADKDGINEALNNGDIPSLEAHIANMKAIESALAKLTLISDPEAAMSYCSLKELQAVQAGVGNTIAAFEAKGFTGQKLIKKLTDEITIYLPKLQKHANTWQIAEAAYKKKILEIQTQMALESVKSDYMQLLNITTKSKAFKEGIAKLGEAIVDGDVEKAKVLVAELQAKNAAMAARRAKYAAKHGKTFNSTDFDDDAFSEKRKNAAVWSKTNGETTLKKHYEVNNVKEIWKAATQLEKHAAWNYTQGSAYMTETLRGLKCRLWRYKYSSSKGIDDLNLIRREIDALTELISKCHNTQDIWVKRDDLWAFCMYRWDLSFTPKICDWLRQKRNWDKNVQTDEWIESTYAQYNSRSGEESYYKIMREYYNEHPNELVGKMGMDESFVSCGNNKNAHFKQDFTYGSVELFIYCPKGTRMINAVSFNNYEYGGDHCGTENWDGETEITHQHECEYILQRGTKLRIIKAYTSNGKLCIDCEVIGQNPQAIAGLEGSVYNDGVYAKF